MNGRIIKTKPKKIRYCKNCGKYVPTETEEIILTMLPCRAKAIEQKLGITRSGVSWIMKRLTAAGLVRYENHVYYQL